MNMTVTLPSWSLVDASPTLTDARHHVLTCDGLSPTARRDHLSGLSGVARVCGRPAAAIPLACPDLRELLYQKPPAAFGLTPQRFGRILGSLRFAMRGMGLHAPKPSRDRLNDRWRSLLDALPEYRQMALGGIIFFASTSGVVPEDVADQLLARFESFLTECTLELKPGAVARRVASNWCWAQANVPTWTSLRKLQRPRMRNQYTPPPETWPNSAAGGCSAIFRTANVHSARRDLS